jgi:hypothetical protein
MKNRSMRILLVSIALLGVFIFLQETWRAKVPSREYRRIKLFELDSNTLVSMQFVRTNTVIQCVKNDGVWMAGGGDQGLGRADVELVLRLVAGLNSMGKGTTITVDQMQMRGFDINEYGFGQPALKIIAMDNQGRHEWQVGRKTALGDMVYVKEVGRDDLYTVSDKLLSIVPSAPGQLRERTLFSGDVSGARRVEIRGSGGFVQMLKEPPAGWQLQQPVSAPADSAEVDRYIERLLSLRIEESEDFVADNVSDFSVYGLQGESRQISLGGVDGSSRMLVLGDEVAGRSGHVYARCADDTSVFALKSDVLELLNVKAEHFRDARVLSVSSKAISSLSVRHGTDALDLQMGEDGRWMVTAPVAWAADAEAVAKVVKAWDEAVIIAYDVKASSSAVDWSFEFGVSGVATNRIEVLSNSGARDGLLVRRDGDAAVYQINLSEIPDEMIDPLAYKSRSVWDLEQKSVQKLSIGRPEDGMQVIERQDDGAFAVIGTNGTVQVDAHVAGELLSRLSDLNTSGFVTYNPRDLEIYGLSNPTLELHVGLSGTNALGRVLLIGRETPDGFYSMVKGRDVVFYLDKILVESISKHWVPNPEPITTE